jgi:hypothetical protein
VTSSAHDADDTAATRFGRGPRVVIAAALVLLIVASAGMLAWLISQRSGDAGELQAERDKVLSRSRQFVARVNTYGPDLLAADGTMPDYRKTVEEVITSRYATEFEQSVPAAEATVQQAKVERTAKVFGAGVATLDGDSATVLLSGQISNSFPKEMESQYGDVCPLAGERLVCEPQLLRVQVDLVKVDGKWLVDNFAPVSSDTGDGTGSPSPSTDPSSSPSTSPSGTPSDTATPSATPSGSP